MKVVSRETSIKYEGQWHWANQPFDLSTDYIPDELKDFVVEYDESEDGKKEKGSINNGLLKKDNPKVNTNVKKAEKTGTLKTKPTNNRGRKTKANQTQVKQDKQEELNNDNLLDSLLM